MNHLLGHLEIHLFVYFPKEITLTELKNKIFFILAPFRCSLLV